MEKQVVLTADGSHSLYVKELDEHYHSTHGAIQESQHVFIQNGLAPFFQQKSTIKIFEVGFGTGLNALLTFIEAQHTNSSIYYASIEAYPLNTDVVQQLNYIELLKAETAQKDFEQMHSVSWNTKHSITENFTLQKIEADLNTIELNDSFDIIYFDAFGPRVQEDLWTLEIFQKMYCLLNTKGVLVTYCAKGQVRRDMQAAGFLVERLPGPPGKREMLRATKK